jgi:hypothetical protein
MFSQVLTEICLSSRRFKPQDTDIVFIYEVRYFHNADISWCLILPQRDLNSAAATVCIHSIDPQSREVLIGMKPQDTDIVYVYDKVCRLGTSYFSCTHVFSQRSESQEETVQSCQLSPNAHCTYHS